MRGTETRSRGFDQVELMQFTGLLDRNGREIYEDDVIKSGGYRWVVRWGDNLGGYYLLSVESDIRPDSYLRAQATEILGNIYENPELLKEGK